jgi:hypothetical protein
MASERETEGTMRRRSPGRSSRSDARHAASRFAHLATRREEEMIQASAACTGEDQDTELFQGKTGSLAPGERGTVGAHPRGRRELAPRGYEREPVRSRAATDDQQQSARAGSGPWCGPWRSAGRQQEEQGTNSVSTIVTLRLDDAQTHVAAAAASNQGSAVARQTRTPLMAKLPLKRGDHGFRSVPAAVCPQASQSSCCRRKRDRPIRAADTVELARHALRRARAPPGSTMTFRCVPQTRSARRTSPSERRGHRRKRVG